jgi:tripartite ATP-independent transporter DctM subunit
MGYLILLVAIVVIALGMPVAFAMGVISLIYLVLSGEFSLVTIPQKIFTGMDSFLLLAIPFFVLAGALMNKGGVTRRLVDFASTLVGHVPGGLGHVTVVANVIMAGMSGTAAADAVATGTVLIPSMVRQGYSRGFAAAISACAATIGPVIPPSVSFVILGSVASISIGQLFLAGVIPGLLMGVYLMVACYIVARRRGYGAANRRARFGEIMQAAWRAGPALLTPVFVIGGMVGGIATATEAAAVAALYSLILACCYGELRWRDIQPMLTEVVVITAVIYLMLGVFNILSWILAIEQIPQAITAFFLDMTDNWVVVLLIINAVLLLCGMFMEPVPIIVLLAPMLMPVIVKYGIDPVHFGLVFVLNILIGVVHPPIGTNMFITCSIARCSVGEFTREALPFIAALVLLLIFVTYVPEVTLFLPKLLAR